jgi:hypothetical protein
MQECLLCVCFVSFPAIESNDDCVEEGEVFEYQEEGDQGQANQGKPSTWLISETLWRHYALFYYYSYICIVFPILLIISS